MDAGETHLYECDATVPLKLDEEPDVPPLPAFYSDSKFQAHSTKTTAHASIHAQSSCPLVSPQSDYENEFVIHSTRSLTNRNVGTQAEGEEREEMGKIVR